MRNPNLDLTMKTTLQIDSLILISYSNSLKLREFKPSPKGVFSPYYI